MVDALRSDLQSPFLPLDLTKVDLPELSDTDRVLRSIDLEQKGAERFNTMLASIKGLRGSYALAKVDELVTRLVEEAIDEKHLPENLAIRAKRAATIRDWTGVRAETGEHFAMRELVVKANRIRFQLIQEWVRTAPNTGLNHVAQREYELLMPAFAAVDNQYLAIATRQYPINSDERMVRGLINPSAIVDEVDGIVQEIPLHDAYPAETKVILDAYDNLIRALEDIRPADQDYDLAERKLPYYRAVRSAFAMSSAQDYKTADRLLAGQIRDGNDVFHVHPIEEGYMKDRIIRSPEIALRAPDLSAEMAQTHSALTKDMMIDTWNDLTSQQPAIAQSLPLLQSSNAAIRHFLGAGWEMDLKLAGQLIPNKFEERVGGIDSSLDLKTIPQRFAAQQRAFSQLFGEFAGNFLLTPRADFDYMSGVDVASHELGHSTAVNATTFERLGGEALVLPFIEEWKATVSGVVGAMYLPYLNGKVSFQELEDFVVRHLALAARYAGMRDHAFIAAYFRKSMMLIGLMENNHILAYTNNNPEYPWAISLNRHAIENFFEQMYRQWLGVINVYDHGTEEDLRSFLEQNLAVTPFLQFVAEKIPSRAENGEDIPEATLEALIRLPVKNAQPKQTPGEMVDEIGTKVGDVLTGSTKEDRTPISTLKG